MGVLFVFPEFWTWCRPEDRQQSSWHLSFIICHLRAKPALWFKAVALGAAGAYNPRSQAYVMHIG
jgi:hypothetical protein